jgi:hypothetical protein
MTNCRPMRPSPPTIATLAAGTARPSRKTNPKWASSSSQSRATISAT